jgi:predicted methyltransferase
MWWEFITQQINKKKVISSDLENDFNEYDNVEYWIEDLQLTKVDENILLDPIHICQWRKNCLTTQSNYYGNL